MLCNMSLVVIRFECSQSSAHPGGARELQLLSVGPASARVTVQAVSHLVTWCFLDRVLLLWGHKPTTSWAVPDSHECVLI